MISVQGSCLPPQRKSIPASGCPALAGGHGTG
jgi:hypothetical protein